MFGLPAVHTYSQDWFSLYFYDIFPYITPAVYPVGMIAQTGSVYLTICVTIERYGWNQLLIWALGHVM